MSPAMNADELDRKVKEAAARGLTLVALRVQAVAIPKTPLEYGDLRSSLVVTPAEPGDLESGVSSDSVYAVPQHERLDYRHKVGGAKYLEKAVLETQGDLEKIMAQAAKSVLGG